MPPARSASGRAAGPLPPLPPPLPTRVPAPYRPWLGPLLVGLTFALGYGLTDRLLRLNPGGWVPLGQNFDHRTAPGTSLESLRQRSGDTTGTVRGNLDDQAEQAAREQEAARERERQAEQAGNDPQAPDAATEAVPGAPALPPAPSTASPSPAPTPRPTAPAAPGPAPLP